MSTNISLTPELEQYAKTQVSSGLYSSVSELMRDALRLLRKKDIEHTLYLKAMHKDLNAASVEIDNGDISPLDIQQIAEQAFNDLNNEHT